MTNIVNKALYLFLSFIFCNRATTVVEYSLLVAVIAMVTVIGAMALGIEIGDTFCDMATDLDANANCGG